MSWDEALDVATETLDRVRRESGAAAILHVQGGGSLGMLKNLNGAFSRLLGATETRGDVCDAAGAWACEQDFGAVDANDLEDLVNARGVVLWGKNVTASSPHSASFVKDARKRGAEVVLVDPLPHRTLSMADRFVQPRPGGDAALALGVARVVLDEGWAAPDLDAFTERRAEYEALVRSRDVAGWAGEADVPVADLAWLARFFAERAPVTTLLGWGMQRRVNGATQVRAVNALHALTGNLGRPGAGASFSTPRRAPFDLSAKEALADRVPRTLRVARLADDMLAADDPPVRAVLIDNMNPVATNPDAEKTRRALAEPGVRLRDRPGPDRHREGRAPRAPDDHDARGGRPRRVVRAPPRVDVAGGGGAAGGDADGPRDPPGARAPARPRRRARGDARGVDGADDGAARGGRG